MSETIKQSKQKSCEKSIKLKGGIPPEPMTKEQLREIVERIIGGLSRLGFREEDFGDLICGEADYGEESKEVSKCQKQLSKANRNPVKKASNLRGAFHLNR